MLEPYYRINQAIGVSIAFLQNGNTLINACGVVINNNQLDFTKKVTDLTTVEDLNKHFDIKSYVSLNLSGKGILQKKVEKIDEINQSNFTQLLPNANFEDFYVQNFISGDSSFVSIVRKAEADKWINLLKDQGFVPLMLSLGPFPIQNIITQLNIYDNDITFHGHLIQRNEKKDWISYQYNESVLAPFPLKIESETVNEKLIIPYTVAFQLVLASQLNTIQTDVIALTTAFQKLLDDKKLQVKGFIILSIFFILLLINFLVFSWINSSNLQLTERVNRSMQSTSDIAGISDRIKNEETLLQNLGWDGGKNKSVLIDQLAALLPAEVSWKEVAINPVDLTISRIQKSLKFTDHKIHIVGNSQKIIPVNEWIARVKIQKWVKSVELDSYIYNNELNTGQFTVIIEY